MKEAEFINNNEAICKLNEREKCMINMLIEKRTVSSNSHLWKKGDKVNFCFLIKSGKFKMIAPIDKVPLNFCLKLGTLVGDFPSIFSGESALSSVQCIEDGEIYLLNRKKLMNFLCSYPAFYLQIKDQYMIY